MMVNQRSELKWVAADEANVTIYPTPHMRPALGGNAYDAAAQMALQAQAQAMAVYGTTTSGTGAAYYAYGGGGGGGSTTAVQQTVYVPAGTRIMGVTGFTADGVPIISVAKDSNPDTAEYDKIIDAQAVKIKELKAALEFADAAVADRNDQIAAYKRAYTNALSQYDAERELRAKADDDRRVFNEAVAVIAKSGHGDDWARVDPIKVAKEAIKLVYGSTA